MEINYCIIFNNLGTPLYSRCYSDFCAMAVKDDVLFSGFLTALKHSAELDPNSLPNSIDMDSYEIQVSSIGDKIKLTFSDMDLVFYKSTGQKYTIAIGLAKDEYESNTIQINQFFARAHKIVNDTVGNKDWTIMEREDLINFEHDFVQEAIIPWFRINNVKDSCKLGDNCPLRLALLDHKQEKSLFDRLKDTINSFRTGAIKERLSSIIYPSRSSPPTA